MERSAMERSAMERSAMEKECREFVSHVHQKENECCEFEYDAQQEQCPMTGSEAGYNAVPSFSRLRNIRRTDVRVVNRRWVPREIPTTKTLLVRPENTISIMHSS
jgi:hypothetical protein